MFLSILVRLHFIKKSANSEANAIKSNYFSFLQFHYRFTLIASNKPFYFIYSHFSSITLNHSRELHSTLFYCKFIKSISFIL